MAQDNKQKQTEIVKPDTGLSVPSSPDFDFDGINDKIGKKIFQLMERVAILEAKTAYLPITRPVTMPQLENHNTDTVAGM